MKKIPTIFVRDEQSRKLVTPVVTPGCEWVFAGEGVPTRKRDGTATMIDRLPPSHSALEARFGLWKRYDAKKGKTPPEGFIPAQDPDPVTGHWPGWLRVGSGPEDKWFTQALWPSEPGTYEFCGPKVNGNPEKLETHQFFRHGAEEVGAFEGMKQEEPRVIFERLESFFMQAIGGQIEGIVWHHPDGRMAKIKRRDFGLRWPL